MNRADINIIETLYKIEKVKNLPKVFYEKWENSLYQTDRELFKIFQNLKKIE